MKWYLEVMKKYVLFAGRARRTEYWMFVLFNILIMIGLFVAAMAIKSIGIISVLYSIAVLLPGLAVSVRRLHDTGRSGWWLLISLIPLIGAIVLIVFYATEGQSGPNQYGPDPKAAS